LLEKLKSPDQSQRYWVRQEIKSRKIENVTRLLDYFLKENATPELIVECIFTAQTAGVNDWSWIMKHGWLDGNNGKVNHPQTRAMVVRAMRQLIVEGGLNNFTDAVGACERIRKTPIPFSYSVFLKKFIFLYVMTLPFGFVFSLGYWVIPVVSIIFYVLASLELIAEEIEDPFGSDANDLPTEEIALGIRVSIRQLLD
jgi:hypothetical protein